MEYINPKPRLAKIIEQAQDACDLGVYLTDKLKAQGHDLADELAIDLSRVCIDILRDIHGDAMDGISIGDGGALVREDLSDHHARLEAIFERHAMGVRLS